jgi:hypothetical protein
MNRLPLTDPAARGRALFAAGVVLAPFVLYGCGWPAGHLETRGEGMPGARLFLFAPLLYIAALCWLGWRAFYLRPAGTAQPRRTSAAQILLAMTGFAALAGAGLAALLAPGLAAGEDITAHPAAAPVLTVLMLAAGWATVVYYRRLDEAALEAHKFAWLWGAQTGLFLVTLAALLLLTRPEVDLPTITGGGRTAAFVDGVLVSLLAAVVGYGVAWAVWWLRKR